jgi:hypothetical protein
VVSLEVEDWNSGSAYVIINPSIELNEARAKVVIASFNSFQESTRRLHDLTSLQLCDSPTLQLDTHKIANMSADSTIPLVIEFS